MANTPGVNEYYQVRITTADFGYTAWTQISSDANTTLQFEQPRGMAVNRNANSPYYGRIYVANTRAAAHRHRAALRRWAICDQPGPEQRPPRRPGKHRPDRWPELDARHRFLQPLQT
ncbi:MAG: hypothetical protein M5U12_17680 [Verrucomicrobia bacterium]|nr:hypothetical protein [Verrucomicrobiota bacterium]